jgi:hypothetical protein
MVGLRRHSVTNQRIFSPKDKAPNIAVGMEGPYKISPCTNSIESKSGKHQLRSQEQTTPSDLDSKNGNSSCAGSDPIRDVNCEEGTLHYHETLLTRAVETSSKTLVNLNGNERMMMGARLLSRVVQQKTRMGVAGAFRKWSCANNAMKATSQLHKTSKELSQQLHCTREKLIVLKSHIKAASIQQKDLEPRLRKVLMPLTDRQRLNHHGETLKL